MPTPPATSGDRLRLLKWFSIIVPAIAIYATETVRHAWIEPMLPVGDMGNVVVGGIALVCTFVFSHIVFRIVDSTQSQLVRRQAELEAVNTITANGGGTADAERMAAQVQAVLATLFPDDAVAVTIAPPAPPAPPTPDAPDVSPHGGTEETPGRMRIPLESHRAVVGEITVTRAGGTFDAAERNLLHLIGDTVNMTIRNAMLQQELRSTAVAEERTWLAREMHDGIAQLMASLLVQIDMVEGRIREGDDDRVMHDLQAVRTTAERANADVRAEIAGLRLLTDRDTLLVDRVREFVEDFEDQTHIIATFTTTTTGGAMHTTLPDLGLQLVRILQEALANVRKHSQATVVDVILRVDGVGVELIVEDNGRGIPEMRADGTGRERHFGLATMQERAQSQGGCLQVTPAVEHASGTRVHARIPQRQHGNGAHTYVSAASAAG